MSVDACPVCDGQIRVLLAVRHLAMLRFLRDVLDREFSCWLATEMQTGDALAATVERLAPDLMVVDAGDFPACCRAALTHITPGRVIVIGPEFDPSYPAAAIANGAAAWLPRDRVGEELPTAMRRVLGCAHDPCPSVSPPQRAENA